MNMVEINIWAKRTCNSCRKLASNSCSLLRLREKNVQTKAPLKQLRKVGKKITLSLTAYKMTLQQLGAKAACTLCRRTVSNPCSL